MEVDIVEVSVVPHVEEGMEDVTVEVVAGAAFLLIEDRGEN